MTDEALIALYQARDPQAVEETRAKYGAYCAAIARRLLSDSRDVEECLSDCALAVWNAIPPACPEHFKGWLGAIVRNRALAIGKANGCRPPQVEESALELAAALSLEDGPHRQAEAAELGRAISRFLREQREPVRAVFLRRYWYADSVEQAARHMGWTVSRTKTVLFRTRGRLREYLEQEGLWNG